MLKTVLKKDSIDLCSVEELEQITRSYPYFSIAQVLLAKKRNTEQQLQKASLYVHNPLWLDYLVNGNGEAEIIPGEIKQVPSPLVEEKNIEPIIEKAEVKEEKKEGPVAEKEFQPEPITVGAIDHALKEDEKTEQNGSEKKLPEFKFSIPEAKDSELLFQPYHTVDYFASQGIKIREDEQPKDKFGKQLKSFTEWLKTMKKLPAQEISQATEPATEHKIVQLAEHSLKDGNVITETMAEVWEKQGNIEKAIDIYNKLSLLDPSKSAYFAAKITELKKIN